MAKTAKNPQIILRRADVVARTGLCIGTIYILISQNKFPKQIQLGPNSVGWLEEEVCDWIQARISERDQKTKKISQAANAEVDK